MAGTPNETNFEQFFTNYLVEQRIPSGGVVGVRQRAVRHQERTGGFSEGKSAY